MSWRANLGVSSAMEVVADNTPFSSCQINSLADDWGFKVTISSPNYPRSNGMTEQYIQTVKFFSRESQ